MIEIKPLAGSDIIEVFSDAVDKSRETKDDVYFQHNGRRVLILRCKQW